jgi:hypothetical protein
MKLTSQIVSLLYAWEKQGPEKYGSGFSRLYRKNRVALASACVRQPRLLDALSRQKTSSSGSFLLSYRIFSAPVYQQVRRHFRREMPFFDFYGVLRAYYEGHEDVENVNLVDQFVEAAGRVRARIKDPRLRRTFSQNIRLLERDIRRLETRPTNAVYSRLSAAYAETIRSLAASREVFLVAHFRGMPAWARFRVMSDKEREVEQLKDTNPELYDLIQKEKELRNQIDEGISRTIQDHGMVPEKKKIIGKIVTTGKDVRGSLKDIGTLANYQGRSVILQDESYIQAALQSGMSVDLIIGSSTYKITGYDRRRQEFRTSKKVVEQSPFEYQVNIYEEVIYEENGNVVPVETFIKNRKEEAKEISRLSRVFPDDIDDLRKYDEGDLDNLIGTREVEYVAMTDDIAKQRAVTRIYPVVDIHGEKIITEGRFKGVALDSMVNRTGRMIEGTAYTYDPKLNRAVPIETKGEDGPELMSARDMKEPYITIASNGQLYLKIPSTRDYTERRNRVRSFSKIAGNVEEVPKSRRAEYRMDVSEFLSVRDLLGSVALSKAAMEKVRNYYKEMANKSQARAREIAPDYTAENLGGFKEGVNLYGRQREALAWTDLRGGGGLIAMDTGTGKTITAVAYVQNALAKGDLAENDKVLYVHPASLRGNVEKAARSFMSDPESLTKHIETMSYAQFSRQSEDFIDGYYAVIFDEAHLLASLSSTRAKNAMRNHPRKILMTASPMENDATDLRILAGIANNENLRTADGRRRVREFQDRFCERIGGRSVSVNKDPVARQQMQEWVQNNVFYAHKQDFPEYELGDLHRETRPLTMPKSVEEEYRKEIGEIKDVIEGMVKRYKLKDSKATSSDIDAAVVRLQGPFKRLNQLANMPQGQMSPKVVEASTIIRERIENSGRTLLWTDDPEFAERTGRELSLMGGHGSFHAVGLSSEIQIWQGGSKVSSYTPRKYTFDGVEYDSSNWRLGVMNNVIRPSNEIVSCTLTSAYTTGLNLPTFDTVVHLDRDSWSSENMKQRTARSWRQGQTDPVTEITLDMVYEEPDGDLDATLDEIRQFMQEMEEDLFNTIVIESQKVALGKEFFEMEDLTSKGVHMNRKIMDLILSPYIQNQVEMDESTVNMEKQP